MFLLSRAISNSSQQPEALIILDESVGSFLFPFFAGDRHWMIVGRYGVSMPSRAYTSFLQISHLLGYPVKCCVNALSGLYLISTNE